MYRTPLRYPGGKQKLAPFIREIIKYNDIEGADYVEPYAGGAGVAMELLLSKQVSRIHLNDSCLAIYAFWKAILDHTEEFCRLVQSASLRTEEWRRQKEIISRDGEFSYLELGFSLFYLNRCNRSGILTGGVIGGLEQKGKWKIDARFPRNDLIQRIETIANHRDKIALRNWDAERFMKTYLPTLPERTLVYCDPPYYSRSANRLYLNYYHPKDHEKIARVVQSCIKHRWLVSYDAATEILGFYADRAKFTYALQYSASKAYKGEEVFIFSDSLSMPRNSAIKCIDVALRMAE